MKGVEGGLGQGRKGGWVVLFLPVFPLKVEKAKCICLFYNGVQTKIGNLGLFNPTKNSELALEELLNSRYSLLHTHLLPHPVVSPRNFIFLSVHLSAPTCLPLPLMWSDTALGSVTGRGRERSGRDQILERMKGLQ